MKVPNMCLVLKLDNEKMVSIADEQTHSVADYNIDTYGLYILHAARFGSPQTKFLATPMKVIWWSWFRDKIRQKASPPNKQIRVDQYEAQLEARETRTVPLNKNISYSYLLGNPVEKSNILRRK